MKHFFSYLVIIIASYKIVTSFISPSATFRILTFEIDVWFYRIIWLIAGLLSAYSIVNYYKNEKNKLE